MTVIQKGVEDIIVGKRLLGRPRLNYLDNSKSDFKMLEIWDNGETARTESIALVLSIRQLRSSITFFLHRIFTLTQSRTYIPPGLTTQLPVGQMPVVGATDCGSEH